MNLYKVEMVGYVPADNQFVARNEFTQRINLAEDRYFITKIEDTGESVPDECRIVALIFDDGCDTVALDFFRHRTFGYVVDMVADGAGVG